MPLVAWAKDRIPGRRREVEHYDPSTVSPRLRSLIELLGAEGPKDAVAKLKAAIGGYQGAADAQLSSFTEAIVRTGDGATTMRARARYVFSLGMALRNVNALESVIPSLKGIEGIDVRSLNALIGHLQCAISNEAGAVGGRAFVEKLAADFDHPVPYLAEDAAKPLSDDLVAQIHAGLEAEMPAFYPGRYRPSRQASDQLDRPAARSAGPDLSGGKPYVGLVDGQGRPQHFGLVDHRGNPQHFGMVEPGEYWR